jgi:hypothetical protein
MWNMLRAPLMIAGAVLAAACAPGDSPENLVDVLAGHYEGSAHSEVLGELPVEANIRGGDHPVFGTLITPVGDFPLSLDDLTATELTLRFVMSGGETGTITGTWTGDEITGDFRLTDDGGRIQLQRTGPPRALGVNLDITATQWQEDLEYLASRLPELHGDAFHTVSEERFEAAVEAFAGRLPSLNGHEAAVGLQEIVALVGDGHTYLQIPAALRRYPIRLYWFGDELRVTHVVTGQEQLLGGRVLAIGDLDVQEADARARRQIARNENEYYVLSNTAYFLTIAEVVHATGISPDLASTWTIETSDGERATVSLAPVAPEETPGWVSASASEPLFRQRPAETLWFEVLPESRTLYVSFRAYPPRAEFDEFVREVFEAAERGESARLVIDLRQNGGGDFTTVRDLLLPRLREHRLNQEGRLFVAIGRRTFSAAMTNAADFLRETNAILVGEPTGARPNGWQEGRRLTLPNSGLTVSYSVAYYEFLDEDLPAVMPHRHIDETWADFRSGTDPVLEWIESRGLPD